MAISPSAAPASPCGGGYNGAKIGRKGEERSGNRLRGPIAGKERSSLTQPGVTKASRSNGSTT